jgi:predicted enzyme related to lactoylglutathione lyase
MVIKRIWDVTLAVSDLGKAVAFYENVLGLTVKYRFGDYAGFDCGGIELGLRTWGDREPPRKGEPCIDFLVDDVDAAVKELRNGGTEILDGPTDTPWGGRVAAFTDPDGNVLQLVQIDWGKYYATCAPK